METKTCSRCRETKTLDLFYTKLGKPTTWCKACTGADRAARWRRNHPEPAPWVMPTEKVCTKCGETKPLDQFHNRTAAKDGKQPACGACMTAWAANWNKANPEYHNQKAKEYSARHPGRHADINLKWRLGIPWGTYDSMFAAQGGKCAICGTDKPGGNAKHRFHTDHDAATGDVRGLLCTSCNNGIGRFNHDPDRIRLAADYLDRWLLSKRPST